MVKTDPLESNNILNDKKGLISLIVAFLIITALFALLPLPGGDDWIFFRGAVHQLLTGKSLYVERYNSSLYHYPPWVAALLIPLGILPFRWGWGLLCSLSLAVAVLIARRYQLNPLKQVLILLSPPMLYLLLHAQIDILALALVFLPRPFWLIGSITKPQVTLGLLFGLKRKDIFTAIIIATVTTILSFLLFGLWPFELLNQPKEFAAMGLNIWGGLWPFQLPLGLVLVFRSWQKNDERYLIASSPFFMPYAATSSLIGPWIVLCSILEDWQAAIVLITWWTVTFTRLL